MRGAVIVQRSAWLASALIVGALAACGDSGDDPQVVANWCFDLERLNRFVENRADDFERATGNFREVLEERARDVVDPVIDGAPESIADDVVALFENEADSVNLDEQEAHEAARTVVNDYIRDECRLDISL